jgi:hypothetical protein
MYAGVIVACVTGIGVFLGAFNKRRIIVYTDGLVIHEKRKDICLRWDQIRKVSLSLGREFRPLEFGYYLPEKSKLSLADHHHNEITITSGFPRFQELRAHVEKQTLEHLVTRANAALARGEAVPFGPLDVSNNGISYNEECIPWEMIDSIKMENGKIIIAKKGKWLTWCKLELSQVPNYHVFQDLTARGIQSGHAQQA